MNPDTPVEHRETVNVQGGDSCGTTTATSMPVVQVAFAALDLDRTTGWYRDVLGFRPAGEMLGASGPEASALMGLPEVSCDMRWLVDTSDFFQLEFFEFREPGSRPGSRRPDDIGWSMLGLDVADLDGVLDRLRRAGAHVGPVHGDAPARRVCCLDPENVWLELRDRETLPPRTARDAQVTTRFIRAVVPDLERSRRFFGGALGLRDSGSVLHGPDDERLWGAAPAVTDSCVLVAANDPCGCAVELVRYPGRAPRPLPADYRISDQGILNMGFGSRNLADYEDVVGQVRAGGYQSHRELAIGPAASRYLVDDQGFSVELLTIPDRSIERDFGFEPLPRAGELHAGPSGTAGE
jgi:catechol 2,3-dioxygenase-like lactoylglutathione lyase family enzyme